MSRSQSMQLEKWLCDNHETGRCSINHHNGIFRVTLESLFRCDVNEVPQEVTKLKERESFTWLVRGVEYKTTRVGWKLITEIISPETEKEKGFSYPIVQSGAGSNLVDAIASAVASCGSRM